MPLDRCPGILGCDYSKPNARRKGQKTEEVEAFTGTAEPPTLTTTGRTAHRGKPMTRPPTRLDQFILRVTAQRACLNVAAERIKALPGPVLELGLGNGRTYDHLRELFPEREIYVFDREVASHPDCRPDEAHLFLGDFRETVPNARERIGAAAALIHGDFGSANLERDAKLAAWLGRALVPLVQSGTIVATDRKLTTVPWEEEPLPEGVRPGVYFMYRVP